MFFGVDASQFMPHGHCILWNPTILFPMVASDIMIFLSYSAIPFGIYKFMKERVDLNRDVKLTLWLFIAFIQLCGFTHLISAWNYWHSSYFMELILKMLTGLVSALTVFVLVRYLPKLISLPSPQDHNEVIEKLRQLNITLEKQVSERTRELEEKTDKLEAVLAQVDDGIIKYSPILDHAGKVIDFECVALNEQAIVQFGGSKEEIERQSIKGSTSSILERNEYNECLGVLQSGEPLIKDPFFNALKNRYYRLRISKYPFTNKLLMFFSDVTLREESKLNEILQMKFSAIGELAGGIGHEINSPLQVVSGKVRKIKRSLGANQELTPDLESIENAILHISKITKNLRRLNRADSSDNKQMSLPETVETFLSIRSQNLINHGIIVKCEYDKDDSIFMVYGNEISVVQILNNLVANAEHALRGVATPELAFKIFRVDGKIILEVNDNGSGVQKDDVNKIFNPLFTTKEIGEGTGLGLSLCKRLARDMNAEILFKQDDRTRFQVVFQKVP